MEQLVSLMQKKQLQKEERLKSFIKILDRKIVQKLFSLRNQAYQRIKNYKLGSRNNVKLLSEKEEEKNSYTNNISSTNQFREALHQLQNYNLVQLEILKKETLCRMVQIVEKKAFQNLNLFFIKATKFQRRFVPFLKVLAFRLHKQTKFLEILKKFQQNREQEIYLEQRRQETISKFVQAIQIKKFHCFYQWKNQLQNEGQNESQIDRKNKTETITFAFSVITFISKIRFKQISNSFIALKKLKQRNTEKEVGVFVLKCRFKSLILKQLQFAFHKIKQQKKPSCEKQNINVDIIKNLSVISSRLNSTLNQAHSKYLRKRRNLILFKYLRKIEKSEEIIFEKAFQKWKKNLLQFNFLSRIKIINQSQQLEDDQQLLVQQYKQLQTENVELQQMFQSVQTYFHTPTGLSVKKSDQKQNQLQPQFQQPVAMLQSQNQDWDDDMMQNGDYSPEFVENIENQNVELKFKVEDQQMRRKQYLEEFQIRKQELLSQIAQKRQNIQVS